MTFGLFFIGMASVVVIASTHREHLVNANYYEQELKFQNQIDAVARTKSTCATLSYDSKKSQVTVALDAAHLDKTLIGAVEFYRPSMPELDRQFPLEVQADGTQMLDVSRLASGLWRVRVRWNVGGQDYFLEQKITVARI